MQGDVLARRRDMLELMCDCTNMAVGWHVKHFIILSCSLLILMVQLQGLMFEVQVQGDVLVWRGDMLELMCDCTNMAVWWHVKHFIILSCSLLILMVQPQGLMFEVQVQGDVLARRGDMLELMCDCTNLAVWWHVKHFIILSCSLLILMVQPQGLMFEVQVQGDVLARRGDMLELMCDCTNMAVWWHVKHFIILSCSLLILMVQPQGLMFEVQVQGDVLARRRDMLELFCDCTNMDFGGVVLGQTS